LAEQNREQDRPEHERGDDSVHAPAIALEELQGLEPRERARQDRPLEPLASWRCWYLVAHAGDYPLEFQKPH